MDTEIFDEASLLQHGKLFSDQFEDRTRIAYHGTSSIYADEVEQRGFEYGFSPAHADEFAALAISIPPGNERLAGDIERHAKQGATRLGFFPLSYAAASHSLNGGGQILNKCRQAVALGGKVTGKLAERLQSSAAQSGCVYAVDLSGYSTGEIAFEYYAFQARVNVPAQRLVAKVTVPAEFDISKLKALQERLPLWACANMQGTLAHSLRTMTM